MEDLIEENHLCRWKVWQGITKVLFDESHAIGVSRARFSNIGSECTNDVAVWPAEVVTIRILSTAYIDNSSDVLRDGGHSPK